MRLIQQQPCKSISNSIGIHVMLRVNVIMSSHVITISPWHFLLNISKSQKSSPNAPWEWNIYPTFTMNIKPHSWIGIIYHPGTNISFQQGTSEDDFPSPKVGYVNFLEGIYQNPMDPSWKFDCFRCQKRNIFRQKVPWPMELQLAMLTELPTTCLWQPEKCC